MAPGGTHIDWLSVAAGASFVVWIGLAAWAAAEFRDAFEEAFGDVVEVPEEAKRTGGNSPGRRKSEAPRLATHTGDPELDRRGAE